MPNKEVATYYGTKKVFSSSRTAIVVRLDAWWGFKEGDTVNLVIRDMFDANKKVMSTMKVHRVGNSSTLFLSKGWGFRPGDVVLIAVSRCGVDDSGISLEEGIESLS